MTDPAQAQQPPQVHYGANDHGECGATGPNMTLTTSEVTCRTCRGWLPIVAPPASQAQQQDKIRADSLTEHADEHARGGCECPCLWDALDSVNDLDQLRAQVEEQRTRYEALWAHDQKVKDLLDKAEAQGEAMTREVNMAVERMRIAEYRESELQKNVEAMRGVVMAARETVRLMPAQYGQRLVPLRFALARLDEQPSS